MAHGSSRAPCGKDGFAQANAIKEPSTGSHHSTIQGHSSLMKTDTKILLLKFWDIMVIKFSAC